MAQCAPLIAPYEEFLQARCKIAPQVRRPRLHLAEMHAKDEARTPWRLLALLIAMAGMSSLSLDILVPAIPGLVTKFAADPASVQLAVSLYLMGLAVAQLVLVPLSDLFGRLPAMLARLAPSTVPGAPALFHANI